MTYKNAHKTVIKLRDFGLIEEIKEKHRYRKAIKYKATSRGLFQRFLIQQGNPVSLAVLKNYKDSIILHTILFKFFEIRNYQRIQTLLRTKLCDKLPY